MNNTIIREARRACVALLAASVLAACGGSKATTGTSKRYERAPIVETTEAKLKTETQMLAAKTAQELDRRAEAQELYRQILQQNPRYGAAHYELSRLLAESGQAEKAIEHARKAVESDKDNVWYALHLATLYRYTNQKEQHIKTWERIVKERPEVLDYYYELSNAYLMNNDAKGAIGALNRVEKRVGVTEAVSLQKAKLWSYVGKEDKARKEMEALADAMPQDSRYNGMLAESYMAAKEYDKAKHYYDRVLAADPENEYIHISLAEYYKATGQHRKAYEELREGFSQNKLSTANKLQVLTRFYTSEEFYGIHSEYAYDLLEVAMRNADDSTTYAAFYGDVLMRQKKYAEAASQFALALTTDSSKYEVWEALLVSEMQAESDSGQLRRDAERAGRLFPFHPLPRYVRAALLYDEGRYKEAIALLEQNEQMGFNDGYMEPETYSLMAECYHRLRDPRCYTYYERYLAKHPNDVMVLNSYAYQLALDNKELQRALLMSKRTLEAEPDNPYYLDTYAWILHLLGDDRQALQYMERAIANGDGTSEEATMHYETIKKALGR